MIGLLSKCAHHLCLEAALRPDPSDSHRMRNCIAIDHSINQSINPLALLVTSHFSGEIRASNLKPIGLCGCRGTSLEVEIDQS